MSNVRLLMSRNDRSDVLRINQKPEGPMLPKILVLTLTQLKQL